MVDGQPVALVATAQVDGAKTVVVLEQVIKDGHTYLLRSMDEKDFAEAWNKSTTWAHISKYPVQINIAGAAQDVMDAWVKAQDFFQNDPAMGSVLKDFPGPRWEADYRDKHASDTKKIEDARKTGEKRNGPRKGREPLG